MGFRIRSNDKTLPENTVELFYRLGKLERLSLEQGESLKVYEANRGKFTDFAIEIPAGRGKTLVGGLIGYFNVLVGRGKPSWAKAARWPAIASFALLPAPEFFSQTSKID
ncbi:MAG: hypothetical protein K6U74_07865 [Firmicutes bacterium]|nr:hypothetical protein [Bacillota bacterium]